MQPSPAMQALIEQIYHIFRRYPVPQKFVVCCEYCLSQQEQKVLRSTSLRAISYSLINAWNSSPGPDPQNSDEVRYFLLEMFFRADIALAPLLDAINSVPGFWSTVSLACLLNRYCEDYIRDNQDDIDNVITTQINAWARNNHPLLKERARQAIENPLKQPEPMTEYQVWEDDWIIDECLCAMYDASSESPGK